LLPKQKGIYGHSIRRVQFDTRKSVTMQIPPVRPRGPHSRKGFRHRFLIPGTLWEPIN